MSEKIVIAKQIYVGFSDREQRCSTWENGEYVHSTVQYILGFATYHEDNAAFRKRQGTILSWSRGLNREAASRAPEIFENTPQSGVKISRNVTHGGGWNDLTVFWRIVDPRGFELEISSGNLAKLFQYCNIDNGVINSDCVYGFDKGNGSKVVLLPVNTEIYTESIKTTEIHEAKSLSIKDVALGDVALGDIITMKNGAKGVYLGKQHLIHVSHSSERKQSKWDTGITDWTIQSTQKHLVCTIATKEYPIDDEILVFATPNIIDVEKAKIVLTEKEASSYANMKIRKNGKARVENLGSEIFNKLICVSFKLPNGTGTFSTIPIDVERVKYSMQKEMEAAINTPPNMSGRHNRWRDLINDDVDPELANELNDYQCVIMKWTSSNGAPREGALASIKMDYEWKHGIALYHSNRPRTNEDRIWSLKITGNPLLENTPTKKEFALDSQHRYGSSVRRVEDTFDFKNLNSLEQLCVDFDNGDGIVRYEIRSNY